MRDKRSKGGNIYITEVGNHKTPTISSQNVISALYIHFPFTSFFPVNLSDRDPKRLRHGPVDVHIDLCECLRLGSLLRAVERLLRFVVVGGNGGGVNVVQLHSLGAGDVGDRVLVREGEA